MRNMKMPMVALFFLVVGFVVQSCARIDDVKQYVENNVVEVKLSDGTPCAVYRGYNISCGWGMKYAP